MGKTLQFSASTNLKSLLGKGLVTDQTTAIYELVKNAYDADATCVYISFLGKNKIEKIIIEDDGSGMSLLDIEKKWMIIGTDSKKDKQFSPIFKRPLNGDKGIGRFSVDCIGAKLDMTSISSETNEKIEISFDWNWFDDEYEKIDNIHIPYSIVNDVDGNQGVKLEISELREEWDLKKLKELVRNLRQFKSPFAVEDNFKIYIDAPLFGYDEREIEAERLEDISSLWVEIECKNNRSDIVYISVNKDGITYEETQKNEYNMGPVKGRVYFFNKGDKIRFKNRFSLRVREFGNIRLYRDEFRIHPYGDVENDWLDIDRRHAQGFARTFSSRDLIGYIQTYKLSNKGLIPLTNRQGLIENADYKKLKNFVVSYGIATLERYYFDKFKKGKNETIVKTSTEIKAATESIHYLAKKVAELDPEISREIVSALSEINKRHSEQINYIKDQEDLVKVYSRLAQQETLLHKIVHQALLDLKAARTALEELHDRGALSDQPEEKALLDEAYNSVDSGMEKMLKIRDDVARKRTKSKLNMAQVINNVIDAFLPESDRYGISIIQELCEDSEYLIDEADLKAIITNLVSNSIKALRESNNRVKEIEIQLKKLPRYYMIFIRDNGVGIDETIRERIFDPFFTTTEKYGGFGLGLSIVDDILKEYDSALELVDDDRQGACFMVKLKR